MSDINWKDGAVCYANGTQYYARDGIDGTLFDVFMLQKPFDEILTFEDFKLNEICIGDYIAKSELDTEEKYNDVVEVFGLFGVYCYISYQDMNDYGTVCVERNLLFRSGFSHLILKGENRVLTYNQLMKIGELKRLMDERSATFNVEPEKPLTAICDSNLEKYKESVRAMETLGYKWCDENKSWYKEIKEWVINDEF